MSPNTVYECHLTSKLTFLAILIAYVETKKQKNDFLGKLDTKIAIAKQ